MDTRCAVIFSLHRASYSVRGFSVNCVFIFCFLIAVAWVKLWIIFLSLAGNNFKFKRCLSGINDRLLLLFLMSKPPKEKLRRLLSRLLVNVHRHLLYSRGDWKKSWSTEFQRSNCLSIICTGLFIVYLSLGIAYYVRV